jgi:hypothetical protein
LSEGLSKDVLPPVGSTLVHGTFQVLALHIKSEVSSDAKSSIGHTAAKSTDAVDDQSYIDIAAGRASGNFTACHRYAVRRVPVREDSLEKFPKPGDNRPMEQKNHELVQIIQSDTALNPSSDSLGFVRWIHGFHMLYARLLHWAGVREILRE